MTRLGLINRDIESHQARYGIAYSDRHRGLPYPGTFVIDESGVVVSKHFDESYRDRASGSFLLSQVGGESAGSAYVAEARDQGVIIRASVDEPVYRPMQKSVVHVELEIADGFHTYVDPVSDGYTPLSVEISDAPGLVSFPASYPAGHNFEVEGLAEIFSVVEGVVKVTAPFKISGTQHEVDGQKREVPLEDDTVVLTLTVSYQVCSDRECYPPAMRRLSIPLVEARLIS
jgi:Thiol:disulfide interchange protein DsbD, N-terminal